MIKRGSSSAALVVTFLLLIAIAAAAHPQAIVLAAASAASCAPDSGSGAISGTVTGTGATPLNNVLVTAYTTYGDRGGYAYTNASGVYQITGLIAGS